MVMDGENVARNLARIQMRIAEAALRAGREPDAVTLVAVSKTFPVALVLEAWEAGQRHFAENRPEEGAAKIPEVRARTSVRARTDVRAASPVDAPVWHMIGHMQSRKADLVVSQFDFVHSVDRLKIARKLNDLAATAGRHIPVLLECNVSGEATKYGYGAAGWQMEGAVRDRLYSEVASLVKLPYLRIMGVMTVAPLTEDPEEVRPVFASLRGLRDWLREQFPQIEWVHLSMGMTDDFVVAIEEGATLVRVGRGVFGVRS